MNNSDPDLIRELAERRGVILVASVGNKNSLVSTTFPASRRAVPGVADYGPRRSQSPILELWDCGKGRRSGRRFDIEVSGWIVPRHWRHFLRSGRSIR